MKYYTHHKKDIMQINVQERNKKLASAKKISILIAILDIKTLLVTNNF